MKSVQIQLLNSTAGRFAIATVTGLAAALILTSIWLARDNLQGAEAGNRLAREIRTTQLLAGRLLSTVTEAETGQRGYLITWDPDYLRPFFVARARLDADLANLEATPVADPETALLIRRIRVLVRAKLDELSTTVELGQSGQHEAALVTVRSSSGRVLMDEIRTGVAAIGFGAEAKIMATEAHNASVLPWAKVLGLGVVASALVGIVALTQRQALAQTGVIIRRMERFTRAFGLTQGMMHDLDGRITFWSRGAERLYGFPQEDALNQLSYQLLHARLPVPLAEIVASLRRDGHWQGELTHRRRDGTDIHVASHWALYRGEAGEEDAVIEVDNDITELKLAEAALRENALRLGLALDASAQGVWQRDVSQAGMRVIWDARCRALFCVTPEALVDHEVWLGAIVVADRALAQAEMARVLDPADLNDEYMSEYRVLHPDGSTVWLLATGRALFEPDRAAPTGRRAVRILGTVRDVSRTKQAEQKQRQADAMVRTIVEAAPGLIYAKDWQGRFLVANKAASDLFGEPLAKLRELTDLELLSDRAQAEAVMANDRRIMEKGQVEAFEERLGDEERVWYSTKAPLRDESGTVLGLVGVSVEITERKRGEDRLRQMVNELNHRVKNTLTTVQAIARQSLHRDHPEIWRTLEARLLALSAIHGLLARDSWDGASLHDVVAAGLAPYGGIEDARFAVSGPSLILRPRTALALALGLHELATNALKYGALSTARGRLELRWEIVKGAQPLLRLTWRERDGPPVSPPVRQGFGSGLVKRGLAQDLGGTIRLSFDDPAGVVCLIEAPLAEVAAPAAVVPFPRLGRA